MFDSSNHAIDKLKMLGIEPGKTDLDFTEIIQKIKNTKSNNRSFTRSFYFFMSSKQDERNIICTTFNHMKIGDTDLLQTSSSPLYANIDDNINPKDYLGIGSSNLTIYNYNIHNVNNLYDSNVQTVYRLPLGTIGVTHSTKLQHFNNYYALPNNTIQWAPIVFGTNQFLNRTGYAAILTSSISSLSLIIIFLDN
jgi:hypothetical protein